MANILTRTNANSRLHSRTLTRLKQDSKLTNSIILVCFIRKEDTFSLNRFKYEVRLTEEHKHTPKFQICKMVNFVKLSKDI